MRKSGETDSSAAGACDKALTWQTSQPQIFASFPRQRSSPRSSETNNTLIGRETMAMLVVRPKFSDNFVEKPGGNHPCQL